MNIINYFLSISKRFKGFTLIELIVVMGIFTTLLGIATINLSSSQEKSSLNSTLDLFVADLKSQQLNSMIGKDDGGGSVQSNGIHLEADKYVLFQGSAYSSSNPSNIEISLPSGTEFSPINTDLIFTVGSGEISGDVSIFLTRSSGNNQKEIIVNKLGVVTGIN